MAVAEVVVAFLKKLPRVSFFGGSGSETVGASEAVKQLTLLCLGQTAMPLSPSPLWLCT